MTELIAARKAPKQGMPTEGLGIFVGYPKGGKTSLAASFPGEYVLMLEKNGGDRIDGRIHDIPDLKTLREILPKLMKEESVKTIAIDSVDVLSDWLECEIAAEHGLEAITDRKEGVNGFELWGTLKTRITNMTSYLKNCGKLVLLVAHTKDAKQDENGKVISPAGINVPGKSGAFIAASADFIGFCSKNELSSGIVYTVSFKGGPLGQWGSRVNELNGRTFALPYGGQYETLMKAFAKNGNGAARPAATVKPPAPRRQAPKAAAKPAARKKITKKVAKRGRR